MTSRQRTKLPPPPSVVQIGPFETTIEMVEGYVTDDGEDDGPIKVLGDFYPGKWQIRISKNLLQRPVQLAETVLHEVLHAIYHVQSMRDRDDEERVVNSFSIGLTQVIKDNPDLMHWISATLRKQ